jgi:hypothetical protein
MYDSESERFQMAVEIIQRLKPGLTAVQPNPLLSADLLQRAVGLFDTSPAPLAGDTLDLPAGRPAAPADSPSLRLADVLEQRGPFPAYSTLLGVCEDGMPFLFDLADPTPGSVLAQGRSKDHLTALLKAVLLSAGQINSPREVQYTIITPNPAEFAWFASQRHCAGVFGAYEDAALARVYELAQVANQRRSGRERGAVHILAVDDIHQLWRQREMYTESQLLWLLQHGARSYVWTVTTLRSELAGRLPPALMGAFLTRINAVEARRNKNAAPQFGVQYGNEWVGFTVPEISA